MAETWPRLSRSPRPCPVWYGLKRRIANLAADGPPPPEFEGCKSLFEIFERSVRLYPENPCIGRRPKGEDGTAGDYHWLSYREVSEKVAMLSSGLEAEGVASQDAVGVFGANS